jgi:hypothetical protein
MGRAVGDEKRRLAIEKVRKGLNLECRVFLVFFQQAKPDGVDAGQSGGDRKL